MGKFIVKDNVPILDEHVLRDDDGEVVIAFDEKKLRQIAARNNHRIRQTGDLIPLVVGHTKDDAPEETQPEIVGFAKDLKVLPFKRTGRKAICAKFLFYKNKVHKARNYPRRSIELWLSDGKIDPISLLGATTPDRDLGLLQLEKSGAVLHFAAGGRKKYQRLIDDNPIKNQDKPMDEKAIVAAVMKALEQTDIWKWCESKMKEEEAAGGDEPGLEDELPDELGGEPGLEEPEPEEDLPGEEEESLEEPEPEDEQPVRYSAGAACPSGTNTSTPAYGARNRNPSNMHKKSGVSNNRVQSKGHAVAGGPQRMARRTSHEGDQLVRFQRALQRRDRELNDLRLRFQRAERERDLMELAAQGYEFDPVEELDYAAQLPEDHYQYHLGRIKKRYQRSPVGEARFDLSFARNPSPNPAQGRTADQAKQIADYASKHGISYEDALTKFDGEQTF